ncbi:hypothetical protein COB64_01075 [Candidatus Wolfebacteria bacterium]|nr:MAG: hypothetical protein COB64_01075 [Candidatus Wolfebacteria bacterium]
MAKISKTIDGQVTPEVNLGHRLQAIGLQLWERGLNRIIFLATDAPMLAPDHYEEASRAFDESDFLFSLALDRGVTIMRSNKVWADMMRLPWSKPVRS